MTRSLLAAMLALALLGSACAGPEDPIEAGVKEYPTDILLGSTAEDVGPTETPAPRPAPGPVVIRPRPRPTRPPIRQDELPPTPNPCPTAHPFDTAKNEVLSTASQRPAEGSYDFRNRGRWTVGDESGTFGPFVRHVEPDDFTDPSDPFYDFFVGDEGLGVLTHYRSVHEDDPTVAPQGPGLYIVSIDSETPEGVDRFQPVEPIKVVAYPIVEGDELDAAGASATGSTVMSFHSHVGRDIGDTDEDGFPNYDFKARVDACGTVLAGWWVELTEGQIQGPGKEIAFDARLAVATQYGGILIQEEWDVAGTDGGTAVESTRVSTISVEPKLPPS